MQKYETTIVVDSLVKAEDLQATVTKVETFITNNGGSISSIEEWGKKRLAYEINRKQYGSYYHIQFEGPGSLPQLLEREYRLEESVLRYLTVKTPSHILRAQAKKAASESASAAVAEPVVEEAAADATEVVAGEPVAAATEETSAVTAEPDDAAVEEETTASVDEGEPTLPEDSKTAE